MRGGLREKGIFKKNLSNKSLVSVITVVFNGEQFIEKTIQSILNQTYNNIEYIIIDGGSIDSTIDIIKKYEDRINYWISEPDNGIYDAMNKGIASASDGYLWFINAGDQIYSNDTVEKIISSGISDIYYGNVAPINSKYNQITVHYSIDKLTWGKMHKGMIVSHQSFIVRKNIATKYDLQYECVSDYDWIIKALQNSNSIKYVNIEFSKYLIGGFSDVNFKKCWLERFRISKKHFHGFYYYMTYYYYIYAIIQKLKNILIQNK